MKKITFLVLGQFLAMALIASAQTAAGVSVGGSAGVGVGGSGYASPVMVSTSVTVSPNIIVRPMPIVPPVDSGFIQFNNLTVESVSATNPPAEILASNPSIYPMTGVGGGTSGSSGGVIPPSLSPTPSSASAPSSVPSLGTCFKFNTQNSASGSAITCPTPPTVTTPSTPSAAPTANMMSGGAVGSAGTGNTASPTIYPSPYPIRYQPYRIEVDSSTHLLLRDRTAAGLGDFASGDQINVFGYYNSDGSIQAYLIRDLSKPAQDEFLQLNNVDLISISTGSTPTQLVVAQQTGYPCYGFDATGNSKTSIACPMGVVSPTTPVNGMMLQNIPVPAAIAPNWMMMRKYVVNVDANTILLDSNRAKLALTDLRVGDQLNIYGDTKDNGQTLNADIVRDLSIPAIPSTYEGKITQVNTDGSFAIQTNDGRTITVKNLFQVGATVQITGVLDRLTNILSQVSNLFFGNIGITVPGMLRVQGGTPLPSGSGGTPNTQN